MINDNILTMTKTNDPVEGWGYTPLSPRVFHYFRDNTSLCGKIGFFFGELEQGKDDHSQNCKPCMKKLQKEKDHISRNGGVK